MAEREPREEVGKQSWPDSSVATRTMFKAPSCEDLEALEAAVAFLGVPFDQGTTNRPGARFGPTAMRDVGGYSYTGYLSDSAAEREPAAGYFDIDTDGDRLKGVTMADCGDVNVVPTGVEATFDRTTRAVRRILGRGAFPVILGGDHAVTFPVVRAFDHLPAVDIIHFDAHMDYAHDYQGHLYAHGSPIRRCAELPFVRNITSIGIRVAREEPYRAAIERGNRIITSNRFRTLGARGVVDQLPRADAIYVTLDIDALDPTEAPGTGTAVPGGLGYLQVRDVLRLLPQVGPVVGMDLVEVAPVYDSADNTSRLGAQLILDLLTAVFSR